MKRLSKLALYIFMAFLITLMPYTTVYATPDNNPDGIPNPQNQIPVSDDANFGHIDPDNQADVMLNLEIPYYNTAECAPGMSPSTENSNGVITGNDNEEKVFNFLRTATFGGHKLNAAQIAGIMGNLKAEHGFQTNSTGNGYHGLAQWGSGRWNNDWEGKLEPQLQHLKAEMDSGDWHDRLERNGFFNLGNSKDDAVAAAYIFARNYEVAIKNGGGSEKWNGNDGEANNFIQNWNGRKNNAIDFYNKYASKVDGPAAGGPAGYGPGRNIWFGDSRTVGMHQSLGDGGDRWVAKVGAGYDWFAGEGLKEVNSDLKNTDTIIVNFGVNDLGNIDKYIAKLNELAQKDWKSNKIRVMSVNPVDEGKALAHSYHVNNAEIEKFNQKMKSGLSGSNISFIDTYSQVKNDLKTDDGVHYKKETYQKIHDTALGDIAKDDSTLDSHAAASCEPSANSIDNGATPYGTSDGYDIYNQADFAGARFGSTNVKDGGCGPSAMAMIISALTGKKVTPAMTAAYGGDNGGESGGGSSWGLPEVLAKNPDFGIKVNKIEQTIEKFNEVLSNGGMVWACGRGGVPFTGIGHCIGIRGRTSSGKWKIFDSGTPQNSYKEWDPNVIINGINKNGNGSATAIYKK